MNEAMRQLDTLLGNAAAQLPRFPPTSRYNTVATLEHVAADGRSRPYLARRFVPPVEALPAVRWIDVVQGDRLDLLAARWLGDPELWWKMADANPTLAPDTLTDLPGSRLRLATPDGLVGVPPAQLPQP